MEARVLVSSIYGLGKLDSYLQRMKLDPTLQHTQKSAQNGLKM